MEHPDSEEEQEEGQGQATLTGFLFGNIDKKGKLEDDVLDEDSKRHLNGLSALGMSSMVAEITENTEKDSQNGEGNDTQEVDVKSETAVDYSDINEVAEEEELSQYRTAMANMQAPKSEDDDYDEAPADDKSLMPPPKWVPGQPPPQQTSVSKVKEELEEYTDEDGSKRPLAAMLPQELANKNVKELFPEFRPNQVLRFSRLFKPTYMPHVWRRKKKKSEEEEGGKKDDNTDGTAEKKEGEKGGKEESREKGQLKANKDGSVEIKEEPSVESMDVKIKDELSGESEDSFEDYCPFQLNLGRDPRPDELETDDAELLVQPIKTEKERGKSDEEKGKDNKPKISDWRFGPAQLWYDMLGIDETEEHLDYGFKLREDNSEEEEESPFAKLDLPKVDYPLEVYHMVSQVPWEEEIIWCGEEVRAKVLAAQKTKGPTAGWVPSSVTRTVSQFQQHLSGKTPPALPNVPPGLKLPGLPSQKMVGFKDDDDMKDDEWYSIFPVENEALVYGIWEKDIIWDAQNMEQIPEPCVLTLDPNDENIILGIPEDKDPNKEKSVLPVKKEKEVRRSRILLGKAGIIKDELEEEEEEEESLQIRDPFNLSNDEYYNPKQADNALTTNLGVTLIQHSTPAIELRQPFFPTHMGPMKLRNFHRPPLKKYSHGALCTPGPHGVQPLLKQIRRKAKMREAERMASGGGDMFFMRAAEDLTGKDGELLFAEYCEEYPPLLNQVGMATKVKNYYKRKPGKDSNPPQHEYGELAYAHTSPFLGNLAPGQCIQAFENNMFRAPVYKHNMPHSDFLIIRTRLNYFIREVDAIFTIGQECPIMEVPGPNSKRANNFIRDFLQVFIYRLFWKSKDNPRRIKMEEIKKAFPSHSESSIRKRLKLCADFKRTGMDSNWWVLKPDFRLPTEEEMRAMVSPEQCCAYYSMLAAEQKLKDAGYGERSFFAIEEENDDDSGIKLDDEIQAAPWNTTRAFIAAMKGRCLLSLNGGADPTGCGEGFSYVKVPNKPIQPKNEESNTPQKRTVTGTDADLRRLNLKDAKQLLRKFGVQEAEIKKLSRWEVIDVVRTMSTEQAKAGQEGMSKFARGNRFSVAEHQERYKEECQRIFDLQNKVLASDEILSTDEGSTSSDDSDFEEMGKNIENMLANKKTSSQLIHEREEAERRELQKMMMEGSSKSKKDLKNEDDSSQLPSGVKKLKITRTFRNEQGREYTRTEIVRKAAIIDTYLKIRQTKDPAFIRSFATLDEHQKEEMKKERRRIQEQLRRIKRNQEREKTQGITPMPETPPPIKKKKKKDAPTLKLKCGACGSIGHMRTNKECPLYNKSVAANTPMMQVAMTEEQEEEIESADLVDEELINVEGTKVKISKQLIEHADNVRRKSLLLKFPKMAVEAKKRRRAGTTIHCDYLKKPKQSSNRRRIDPVVTLSSIFENILNEMRDMPDTQPFLFPVNSKTVPDYYKIVKKPMDLQTIRENIRNRKYTSREAFMMDIAQIVRNSEVYNGAKSVLTLTATRMVERCLQRVAEKEDKLMRLEKAINPLLDDNDLVALSYIFAGIINDRLKTIENSWPFHQPVNKKLVKDYYDIIKTPMDLSTLLRNVNYHKYHCRDLFLHDVGLITVNSERYNGKDSPFTETAKRIYLTAKDAVQEQDETMTQLEEAVKLAQELALDAADTDSVMTGTSVTGGQEGADLESVDYSLSKDHTIIHDEMRDDSEVQSFSEGFGYTPRATTSRDEDYVDVEGDDENSMDVDDSYNRQERADRSNLEDDLQITPDNSDNEESSKKYGGRLSSSGSDSEREYREEYYGTMDTGIQGAGTAQMQSFTVDENAQAYPPDMGAIAGQPQYDDPGDDSFDPMQFFTSFGNQGAQAGQEYQQDINRDLVLSDSGSDSDNNDFQDVGHSQQ